MHRLRIPTKNQRARNLTAWALAPDREAYRDSSGKSAFGFQ